MVAASRRGVSLALTGSCLSAHTMVSIFVPDSQVSTLATFQVPVDTRKCSSSWRKSASQRSRNKCCAVVFTSMESDTKLPHKSTEATFPCLPIESFSYISHGFGNQTGLYNRINKIERTETLKERTVKKELFECQHCNGNHQSSTLQDDYQGLLCSRDIEHEIKYKWSLWYDACLKNYIIN